MTEKTCPTSDDRCISRGQGNACLHVGGCEPCDKDGVLYQPVAPIIDAEQEQNAARAATHHQAKMIYDKDIAGADGESIGVSAFRGASNRYPVMLLLEHPHESTTRHLSLDEAMGLRDALTAAIASLTGAP